MKFKRYRWYNGYLHKRSRLCDKASLVVGIITVIAMLVSGGVSTAILIGVGIVVLLQLYASFLQRQDKRQKENRVQ